MNEQMPDNSFEKWEPDKFAEDARYQLTIRTFLEGKVKGDVLDTGCGSRVFYSLSEASSWTGVDISARMLSGITFFDRVENMRMMHDDMLLMQFPDESFDTVLACFVLHHLALNNIKESRERVQRAFHEAMRVLKPNGRFIICENCRGPLEAPYHLLFPILFPIIKKTIKIDLPYFWRVKDLEAFGKNANFKAPSTFVHVPIVEWIYNPVFGFSVPPILSHDLIQKMTIFEFRKSG